MKPASGRSLTDGYNTAKKPVSRSTSASPSIGDGQEPWVDAAVGDQPPAAMVPEIVEKVNGVALFDTSFDNAEETCLCEHKMSQTVKDTIVTSCDKWTYAELFGAVADESQEVIIQDLITKRTNITFSLCSNEKEGPSPAGGPDDSGTLDSTEKSGAIDFGGKYLRAGYFSFSSAPTATLSFVLAGIILVMMVFT